MPSRDQPPAPFAARPAAYGTLGAATPALRGTNQHSQQLRSPAPTTVHPGRGVNTGTGNVMGTDFPSHAGPVQNVQAQFPASPTHDNTAFSRYHQHMALPNPGFPQNAPAQNAHGAYEEFLRTMDADLNNNRGAVNVDPAPMTSRSVYPPIDNDNRGTTDPFPLLRRKQEETSRNTEPDYSALADPIHKHHLWTPTRASQEPVRLGDGTIFNVSDHIMAILSNVNSVMTRPDNPPYANVNTPFNTLTPEQRQQRYASQSKVWQTHCAGEMARHGAPPALYVIARKDLMRVDGYGDPAREGNEARAPGCWREVPGLLGTFTWITNLERILVIGPNIRMVDMQHVFDCYMRSQGTNLEDMLAFNAHQGKD